MILLAAVSTIALWVIGIVLGYIHEELKLIRKTLEESNERKK